ncbi:MAG: helix-turn-helix transcriptional regulator [Candidatus Binatia bacterium]
MDVEELNIVQEVYMSEEILTAKELATKLKVSLPAVRRWTREGLPARPLGGRLVRFELDKALSWLEQRSKNKQ